MNNENEPPPAPSNIISKVLNKQSSLLGLEAVLALKFMGEKKFKSYDTV